jgi:hypothetical protein
MMKHSLLVALALLAGFSGILQAQVVSGRSNTGSITLTIIDTSTSTNGKKIRALSFELEFSDPSGNKALEAKETGRLRLVISNNGKVPQRNVVARVTPLAPPTAVVFNDSIMVGDIPVNASRYAIFYFTAKEGVPSQIVTVQVALFSRGDEAAEPKLLTFLTRNNQGKEE